MGLGWRYFKIDWFFSCLCDFINDIVVINLKGENFLFILLLIGVKGERKWII